MKINFILFIFFLIAVTGFAQNFRLTVKNMEFTCAKLESLQGEKSILVDSVPVKEKGLFLFSFKDKKFHHGFYRLAFPNNSSVTFIYDGREIEFSTDGNNISDSIKVISSESNKLYYQFIKLNKAFKTKADLLRLILASYPEDDPFYNLSKKRLNKIQNEYIQFVNAAAQKEPRSFLASYIKSAQLPIVETDIHSEKQLIYLKAHALDNVDFNNSLLINSDVFTNKTIEYLTYYRNSQLPRELLEKEFMAAVDTILNKAKVNEIVYRHITEYMIDGFREFGFDNVLDYIVENYIVKDNLCLNESTESLIQKRINQSKFFVKGRKVPDIILPDPTGKEIDLAEINSESILIIFYASWCPHCQKLLPELNELYKNENEKRPEILAISLDKKKEDWTNFIKTNNLNWINVSDQQGWDSKAATDFFIYATPTMLLVDKKLNLIAKPKTVEEIKMLLSDPGKSSIVRQ